MTSHVTLSFRAADNHIFKILIYDLRTNPLFLLLALGTVRTVEAQATASNPSCFSNRNSTLRKWNPLVLRMACVSGPAFKLCDIFNVIHFIHRYDIYYEL